MVFSGGLVRKGKREFSSHTDSLDLSRRDFMELCLPYPGSFEDS